MRISKKILSMIMVLLLVVGIVPTSVITVFAASMTVNVEMPSGETVTLDVEPADSIENVKQKMQDKTGLKPETTSLYFEDKLLEDGRTLADYNIRSGSTLKLTLLAPEDTGETYTLTIKYAVEDSNGIKIGTEISDKVITGVAPGTVIDLSDYWPDKMSVTGSNGETYYFLNHSKYSNNINSPLYRWVADKNDVIYVHYAGIGLIRHAPYELTFDPNGGAVYCQKILYLSFPFTDLSSEDQLVPVRDGYRFLGWSLDKNELSNQYDVVKQSGTLYAIWEELPSVQVGMTTLYDGEYTTDGQSTTTTKPESGGYAYFKDGVLTLNNFTYCGGGNDYAAVYSVYPLTIKVEGRNSITREVTGTDTDTDIVLRGIWVRSGKLRIIGDNKEDFLEVNVNGHDNTAAYAVNGNSEGVVIENCTLEAKSATGGAGLYVAGEITVVGAEVLGSSESISINRDTFGIYVAILKVRDSNVVAVAEDNSYAGANGIWIAGSTGKLIFESGSIVAETSDVSVDSYAVNIASEDVTLPAEYWMRTSASGEYVNGTWDGANVGPYFELTTTKPHIHSYTRKTNDTQHWMECVCGTAQDGSLEDHKGGTATCTAKAKCSECSEEYGDYGAHNWDADWTTDSEKHWYKCLNTGCTEINNDNPHSGGTATCKDLAKCEFCDMAYGDTDADNHSYSVSLTWTDDEHFYECSLCSAKKDKALHDFTDDCDETCNTCEYVRVITHAFDKLEKDSDGHWYICSVCGVEAPEGKEAHSGGTATCTAKAKCEVCDTEYGDVLPHDYELDCDEDEHWYFCSVCSTEKSNSREAHKGGTATCTAKAKCEVCGTEYGSMTDHVYENGKCKVCNVADPDYKPDSPQTGDDSMLWLWILLMVVSGGEALTICVHSRKRRAN